MLKRINLTGNPNLGVYISVTDEIAIVPLNLPVIMENSIKEALEVEVIRSSISGSNLAGALSAGNSKGVIVSPYTFDKEIENLKSNGINVAKIPDKYTAIGNIMALNDNGAIVTPLLSDASVETIEEVLELKVKRFSIANSNIIGSLATVTNKGALLHPKTTNEEIEFVEKVFKVPADIGTVGRGIPLVGACSIANSSGVIVAEDTTGPEMARIEESLGFLEN
ncbi:MAG: translation initiation factor IF-6 [Methanobacteriaceae archaeon]|jgi:translation initiation factor 6|nr:translation initiation factor IF-6 [Candidatus Methanorudis spinitermitis]